MDNILKQYKFNIYNERLSNFTNSNGVWQDGTTPVCRDKNGKLWAISGHSHSGSIAMYSGTNMSNLKQLYFIKTDFEVGKAGVAFNNIKYPKGRFELIKYKNNYIIIDYAHTPDGVLNILTNVMNFKHNKIITIIGCGGNRDKTKRSKMGYITCKYSDNVIFTNDNPRYEDEKDIMNDITNNLKFNNYEVIYDRKEAIKKGISLLKNKDILLILGKGHEEYQIIKDKKIYLSDYETVISLTKN